MASSTVNNIIAAGKASAADNAQIYSSIRDNSVKYDDLAIANMRARANLKVAAMKADARVAKAKIDRNESVDLANIDVKTAKAEAKGKKTQRMAGLLAAAGQGVAGYIHYNKPDKSSTAYKDAHDAYIQKLTDKLNNPEKRGETAVEKELRRQREELDGRVIEKPTPRGGASGDGTTIQQGTGKGGDDLSMKYMDKLTSNGMSKEQAAATVGHLLVETGGFKHMEELAPNRHGTKGYGHLQWTDPTPGKGRRTDFMNYSKQKGNDPQSFKGNSDFLVHEITTNFNGSWTGGGSFEGLQQQGTLEGASTYLQNKFIRPGEPHTERRLAEGRNVLARWEALQNQ